MEIEAAIVELEAQAVASDALGDHDAAVLSRALILGLRDGRLAVRRDESGEFIYSAQEEF